MSKNPKAPAAELETVARQCETLEIRVHVDVKGSDVELMLTSYKNAPNGVTTCMGRMQKEGFRRQHAWVPGTFADAMSQLAGHVKGGSLLGDSLQVKSSKAPVKNAELKRLALATWHAAFGVEPPSQDALREAAKRRKPAKQQAEELIALLRSGPKGVAEWNARALEVARIRKFRDVDFSGLDLRGVHFPGLDLQGARFNNANLAGAEFRAHVDAKRSYACSGDDARFVNADLQGANLKGIKFENASFEAANLQGAQLAGCVLKGASLKNANLRKADLGHARLQGADLTGADLSDARLHHAEHDEKTVLPAKFVPPPEMAWVGKKLSAAVLQSVAASAKPLDFDAFYEKLQDSVDPVRLSNATKMLKADSFQLFAEAKADSLTGIVKSQSDSTLVYSCRLEADGSFACCTQNLNVCGGLRGALCKHLLVLIIGLAKAGQVDPTNLDVWIRASRLQKPVLDKDVMSETFLRYKGAEAGEVDWRPTETIPEDYYAL
jgi:uncharacterized protein YjbI with pentapeptide repeats